MKTRIALGGLIGLILGATVATVSFDGLTSPIGLAITFGLGLCGAMIASALTPD